MCSAVQHSYSTIFSGGGIGLNGKIFFSQILLRAFNGIHLFKIFQVYRLRKAIGETENPKQARKIRTDFLK